jgi:8-oxo-dGTP diphosphatase
MIPRAERHLFPVTVHLFLLRDEQVLLARRFNTGYQDGNYSVPAGHLDGGESVIQAARREAREEIGIELLPESLEFAGVMHRREEEERVDFFLATRRWQGEPVNAEPHRCDELRWERPDALPANTIPYVRRAVENYLQGRQFDLFGWEEQGNKR